MAPARQRRRLGLSTGRGAAIIIGAGLVLLLGFTAYTLRLAEDAVRKNAESRVRTTAELSARLVGEQEQRFVDAVRADGRRLSTIRSPTRARLDPADRALVAETLRGIVTGVSGLDSAVFTDESGRAVVAYPDRLFQPGVDLSGREWYRGVTRTHRPYVSQAFRSTIAGRPRLTVVAVPVRAPGGRVLGIVAVAQGRGSQRLADELAREVGARIIVTDQAGVVVAHSGRPGNALRSRARDPLVRQALRGRSGVQRRDVEGRATVSGYATVPDIGWTVTADVDESAAFSDIPRLRLALVLGAAVVAFLLFWLVPILVRRLGHATEALDVSDAFQRDLLPTSLPAGVSTHYAASERRMRLGGDFLDAVRLPDGSLAVCIGDVCGHGPRAAALSATLRAGWRTLATAGVPVERLDLLDRLVESSRRDDDLFATVACAVIPPAGDRVRIALAGHPPPVLVGGDGRMEVVDGVRGPALGLGAGPQASWPAAERPLAGAWTLTLYTDGLIEARTPTGRVGIEGLETMLAASRRDGRVDPDALVARVAALGGDAGLDDDVALLLVDGPTAVREGRRERRALGVV